MAHPIRFLRRLGERSLEDSIDDSGAMMAYYAVLSVFPMLLFVVTLGLLVLPPDTINDGARLAREAAPPSARALICTQVQSLIEHARPGYPVGTAAFALWGASRGASALMLRLDRVFGVQERRSWWRRQLIAIGATLGLAVLLLIALGLLVVGPAAGHFVADRLGLGAAFDLGWSIARWIGAGLVVMVLWALAYKILPNRHAPLRVFSPGVVVGVLLWLGISWLFGFYLTELASYSSTYGALGSGIALLTWLWVTNVALLFGAEIDKVRAELRAAIPRDEGRPVLSRDAAQPNAAAM